MSSDFDKVHKAKDSADPLLLFHFLAKCRLFLICPVVNMKLLFVITEESQGFFHDQLHCEDLSHI